VLRDDRLKGVDDAARDAIGTGCDEPPEGPLSAFFIVCGSAILGSANGTPK
jgi:hypothetical protein